MSRMSFLKSLFTERGLSKLSTERRNKPNVSTSIESLPFGERPPIGLQGTSARRMFHFHMFGDFQSRINNIKLDIHAFQSLWERALQASAKTGKAEVALRGYQRIQQSNLKEAMSGNLNDFVKQAAVVSFDWWDKLSHEESTLKGRKYFSILNPFQSSLTSLAYVFQQPKEQLMVGSNLSQQLKEGKWPQPPK